MQNKKNHANFFNVEYHRIQLLLLQSLDYLGSEFFLYIALNKFSKELHRQSIRKRPVTTLLSFAYEMKSQK